MLDRLRVRRLSRHLRSAFLALAAAVAPVASAQELILNGDGEANAGGDGQTTVAADHWSVTLITTDGNPVPGATGFTLVAYGSGSPVSAYPDASSPGPGNRGANFFAGGESTVRTIARQTPDPDLTPYLAAITASQATCTFSAWLGGFGTQDDTAEVHLTFVDAGGVEILPATTIGPVTQAQRASVTGLFYREVVVAVPTDARSAKVEIQMDRVLNSYCNGYVDNVSLVMNVVGTTICAGDGSLSTACPCMNYGAAARGCANSVATNGAFLTASGTTNPDTLVLAASGMPSIASVASIYIQGDALASSGIVFGDGLRCVDGALIRLGSKPTPGGTSQYPEAGNLPVSVRGGVTPGLGDTRYYQAYYRNAAAAFCPPATFNVTNGVKVVW